MLLLFCEHKRDSIVYLFYWILFKTIINLFCFVFIVVLTNGASEDGKDSIWIKNRYLWNIIRRKCRFGGVLHEISLWICWLFSNYCFYLNEWGSIHFLWFSEHNSSFSIGTLFPITDSRVQFSKYRRNSNMVLLYLWQIHELFWAVQLWGCNRIIQVISSFIIWRIQRERIVFSYLLLKWSFCFE